MAIGEKSALPTAMKLYFICLARTNRWGHAPFIPGELGRLLGGVTPKTRKDAIKSLKYARIAAPESTSLCIVLNCELSRRADRATHTCIEPTHLDRQRFLWGSSFGWEDEPDAWHSTINDPELRELVIARRTRTRTVTETEIVELVSAS